jgi:hypothetical protein
MEELKITDPQVLQDSIYNEATRYIDNGWSIIPLARDTRKPLVSWEVYQSRQPTAEELERWFSLWPNMNIGLVCGAVSGVVVLDCDNAEAMAFAAERGLTSPFAVRTKRGVHYYFRHPMDGNRYGNHAGANPGSDWPKVPGLDFRGDGGFVVLPPSVRMDPNTGEPCFQYAWEPRYLDWDDCAVWKGAPQRVNNIVNLDGSEFCFDDLDLGMWRAKHPAEYLSVWDKTRMLTEERGLIDEGEGRNALLCDFASEEIMRGLSGFELRARCLVFQNTFFRVPLGDREFERTIQSMEAAERRNHPERFDALGHYIYHREPLTAPQLEPEVQLATEQKAKLTPFFPRDAAVVRSAIPDKFLIEPILAPASITAIFGYTGHGKSLVVQGLMWALANGAREFGPYRIDAAARVLYFDWENGARTICDRAEMFNRMIGDPGENLGIWSPALLTDESINMHTNEGIIRFSEWTIDFKPDVVVLDTVRAAWPGLEENKAEAWTAVNQLALRLRNAGIAVVILHHANKPNAEGLGREAGSANQLSNVELQLRVTQLFKDEEVAKAKAGKYDAGVWDRLSRKAVALDPDSHLVAAFEISTGKVRSRNDNLSDRTNIGYAERTTDGTMFVVSDMSKRQWALTALIEEGRSIETIASTLGVSTRVVKDWCFGGK